MRLVFFLCFALTTDFTRCERLVDITEWYTDMMNQGAFRRRLTTEQEITKNHIVEMVEKSARTKIPKLVSKKTLESYEAIFMDDYSKDETEMDETEMDMDQEEDEEYPFYESKNQKNTENNTEKREETQDPRNEPPLNSSKTEGSENVTDFREITNQNATKNSSWINHLGKCYHNASSSYLDVFYWYESSISNGMFHLNSKSSKKHKKFKKKKRKIPQIQRTCRMKTRCSLRCWLCFEFKMCIPQFNWLAINTTRNGVKFEEYLPFPNKSKVEIKTDGGSDKLKNKDEKQENDMKSTERVVEKLLNKEKSNSREDLSVDRVTKIIDEKSKEQLIKIQTLELSISKLENSILKEQLSKNNDSSSISRLENQILRLENELIKLNQTYIDLRKENEQLKKGQRRYLELSPGSLNNQSGLENHTMVIGKHKTKLTELEYQLRNQSELVKNFKEKLEQVEDNNRMLYHIVMNQSLLISQVMKNIQVLSDQIQESNQKKQDNTGSITAGDLMKIFETMVSSNKKSAEEKPATNNSPKETLKYHGYDTCTSGSCSKSNQHMRGGLPKSGSVNIPDLEEEQNENGLEKEGLEKYKKNFNVETNSETKAGGKETRSTISSQKRQTDESVEKLRPKTDKIPVEKSRDADEFPKEKVLSHPKIDKEPETEKEEKTASGRKKPLYVDPDNKDPKDCYEHYQKGSTRNGAYRIKPAGFKKTIEVFCDMKNGGWTVIQRRQGGTTNFFRDWSMYKKGFGGVYGEHWIGNDIIHQMTNQKECKLRIDLTDWDKNKVTAFYDYFMLDHESEGYLLHVEGFSGEGGDSFTKHNLHKFSTKDVDNDKVTKQFGGSCANRFSGAWWYHKCYSSNLNGVFYRNGQVAEKQFDGIAWKSWKGPNYSMMKTEMKIAPATADMK